MKLGLHSAGFLSSLMARELRLSLACGTVMAVGCVAIVVAEATGNLVAGGSAWIVALATAVAMPAVLGGLYARSASGIEDESVGLVDVATLPPFATVASQAGTRGE